MAKIAGRKNDGAWSRFNEFLLKSQASVLTEFATNLVQLPTFEPAYQIIKTYILNTDVGNNIFPTTPQAWAAELSLGIPRQIWFGVTSYDYYAKNVNPNTGETVYDKLMQPVLFPLSKQVRALAKRFRYGNLEVGHLASLTRPAPTVKMNADQRQAFIREKIVAVRAWAARQAPAVPQETAQSTAAKSRKKTLDS